MQHHTTRTRSYPQTRLSRREFGAGLSAAALAATLGTTPRDTHAMETQDETAIPLKIGHRAASMKMVGDFDVFKMARRMPGLIGVELQVAHGKPNLRDWDAVRRYKREANRWGMMIPSVAGIFDRGVSMLGGPPEVRDNLGQAVRVAEFLGASVALVAFFRDKAPDMTDESSYGPVVELLQEAAPKAAEAGVTFGLENSLSPAHNQKLVDLVDHPNVLVYYDPCNMAHYGYEKEAVPGIRLLGKERICQVHVKNGKDLIEQAGPVDWPAAFEALHAIGYEGWYVFESQHADPADVIADTNKNIAFLQEHCKMPVG